MSPRWLHWPAVVSGVEVVGTCTGWNVNVTNPIRVAAGWTAGPYGANSVVMQLRSDSFGSFLQFSSGSDATAFISSHGSRDVEIVHDSGSYYWSNSSGGGMSIFATVYVQLNLSGWSGTLPGVADASSVNLA